MRTASKNCSIFQVTLNTQRMNLEILSCINIRKITEFEYSI